MGIESNPDKHAEIKLKCIELSARIHCGPHTLANAKEIYAWVAEDERAVVDVNLTVHHKSEKAEQLGEKPAAAPAAEKADKTQEPPKPDEDGWIEWKGGECPVPEGSAFDLKMRGGLVHRDMRASWCDWHGETGDDIIAYRVLGEQK